MNEIIVKIFFILLGIVLGIIFYYNIIFKDILVIETNIEKTSNCINKNL